MLNSSVERAGPPAEMVHTMSKVRNASIARIAMHTTITDLSIGSVRKRNTRQAEAPSIAAASNGSRGRLCRPASSNSANHGVHSQISANRITPNAPQRCASHGCPGRPRASSAAFTTPNWSLNIQRIMMAATTGATISGSSRIVCSTPRPENFRFRITASPRPSTSEHATLIAMNDSVLGRTTLRNPSSVRT